MGRRGLCGTLFVHKLAGALAEQRKSLDEIKQTVEGILNECRNLRTIGVSLSGRVALPNEQQHREDAGLKWDEIEIGMGIHGERGRHVMKITKSAELVAYLLSNYLFRAQQPTSSTTNHARQICLMINNLGGLSNLELSLLANDCVKYITENRLGQVGVFFIPLKTRNLFKY